jgi:hypothetical protein
LFSEALSGGVLSDFGAGHFPLLDAGACPYKFGERAAGDGLPPTVSSADERQQPRFSFSKAFGGFLNMLVFEA